MRCNDDARNTNRIPTWCKQIYINIFKIPAAKQKVRTEIHNKLGQDRKTNDTTQQGLQKQY
jgi:hypothetical protein